MLERYLIRYFLAVVDQGGFSRAAIHCNVSQPTLSIGIAKLETILGRSLFIRSSQRVELTAAGAQFLNHARRIEREFNAAAQSMDSGIADRQILRIGVLASIPGAIISACIDETRPSEQFRLEILFANERELVAYLGKGRIDLALTLVGRGGDRFKEKALMSEGYALAISAGHPLAQLKEIEPEALAQEDMIVRRHCEALSDVSRFFVERGVRPHFAFRSTNDERVLQMVAAGLGLTVMPECYRWDGVARPVFVGFGIRRTIGWMAGRSSEYFLDHRPPLLEAIENMVSRISG